MPTRLYVNNAAAPYTPTTTRGAWDQTSGAAVRYIDLEKSGTQAQAIQFESTATTNWDMLLGRFVSSPLEAQTISGTFNLCLSVTETPNANADMVYHIHIYVVDPATDAVRGTLLADYTETLANEFPVSMTGQSLAADQTLGAVTCQKGDRLVVEIGARSLNTSTTTYGAALWYGLTGSTDLTPGGNSSTQPGWIEFSTAIAFISPDLQVSQLAVESLVLSPDLPLLQVSQYALETLVQPSALPDLQISQLAVEVLIKPLPTLPSSQVIIIS